MKKILGFMMISIMLVSIMPLAFAEQINPVVARRAKAMGSVDDCVDFLSEKFPDAKEERLEAECKGAAKSLAEGKMPVKARMLKAEDMAQLRTAAKMKIKANLPNVDMKKIANLDRARLKKYAAMDNDELKKVLANVKVQRAKVSDLLKKRTIINDRLKAAELRYDKAVKRYRSEKESFMRERAAWRQAVEDGNETAAIEHAKAYLLHAGDLVIEYLEKVKARIESNDDLTEEEAAEMISDVDEKIQMMEDLKSDVEAAQTKEDLKEIAKKITKAWSRSKDQIRMHADTLVRTRVGDILMHTELLENKMNKILEDLEAQGKNITSLEEQVDEFSELIDDARELYKEGKELLIEAKENDDPELAEEGREKIAEAHKKLVEAHKILMEIVREAKAQGWVKRLTLNDDDVVEIVVENDDSTTVETEVSDTGDESSSDDGSNSDSSVEGTEEDSLVETGMDDDVKEQVETEVLDPMTQSANVQIVA